jgi:hypothetical protein
MNGRGYNDELICFADQLLKCGVGIIEGAADGLLNQPLRSPKVITALFLCRTMCNFRAAMKLAKEGLIVEARILTRVCLENLFCMERLHGDGPDFVEKMWDADQVSQRLRASFPLENAELRAGMEPDTVKNLEAIVARIKAENPKAKLLQPKAIATAGTIGHSYIAYSVLSSDAAHPSLQALARHFAESDQQGNVSVIDIQPTPRPGELAETQFLACMGLLGGLVAANLVLGPVKAGEELPALTEQFQKLREVREKQEQNQA